ncbi:MAG: signal peptidase I [Treponema sp.]
MKKNINRDLYSLSYKLKKELHRKIARRIFNIFLLCLCIILFLNFLIFPVRENSNSMSPDIPKKSFVFVTPVCENILRGDVVLVDKSCDIDTVFEKVLNSIIRFFTFQKAGLYYNSENLSTKMGLRRVVGLPGDTIYMKDFIVYVKPAGEKHFFTEFEVAHRPYNIEVYNLPANWDDSVGLKAGFTPVTLGVNQYFVLADNRFTGMDSRLWGIVEKSDFLAKSLVLYFPFNKFKIF